MKKALAIMALLGILIVGSGLRPSGNREVIYASLDTLAEILTAAKAYSPETVADQALIEGAIDGLLDQLDPHSSYYNEDRYRTMKEDQQGAFYGVGILVGYQNKRLTVISPLDGAPAARAGIRSGDVIVQIDETRTKGLNFDEAIRLLRGEKGSEVAVVVSRQGVREPLRFTVRRAEIPNENVRASFMLDDRQTGYIALRDFGENAAEELKEAALDLERQGMTRLALDLRGNPGGLLPQAIKVASLFIPGKKLVVSTQGRLKNANQEYHSERTSPLELTPLVVLIDRGSASASEIVAGAIQDHDRGLIVGVNSWGKGLVQSVFPIANGTKGLALTTSRYYTPSGRNIQGSYESLEAYYNPESSEDYYFGREQVDPRSRFKTRHGREVIEVRGITPDVYLPFPKTPESVQKLDMKNVFFNFAARHQDDFGLIRQGWQADGQVMAAFRKALKEEGDFPEEAFDQHAAILRQKLTYQFLYISNSKWAWRHMIKHDHHVKASRDLFEKAGELLRVFKGEEALPSNYSDELKQYARLHKAN